MSKKQTIAVDIDDVLAANAKAFVEFSNKKWGTSLVPEDYHEHWAVVWGVDEDEASKRGAYIHENVSGPVSTYENDNSAKDVLLELSKKYRLVIVTSRRRVIEKDTFEWLDKHYKGVFEEVHFAGMWDQDASLKLRITATKTEVLEQIGANYLIDDQAKHCISAAEAGIQTILFGDYRWSRNTELRPNMVRAKNWDEVLEYFNGRS